MKGHESVESDPRRADPSWWVFPIIWTVMAVLMVVAIVIAVR
jgi:tryptophan-rich sensory protein